MAADAPMAAAQSGRAPVAALSAAELQAVAVAARALARSQPGGISKPKRRSATRKGVIIADAETLPCIVPPSVPFPTTEAQREALPRRSELSAMDPNPLKP